MSRDTAEVQQSELGGASRLGDLIDVLEYGVQQGCAVILCGGELDEVTHHGDVSIYF